MAGFSALERERSISTDEDFLGTLACVQLRALCTWRRRQPHKGSPCAIHEA
ncbi:Unknown protein sequence [Pseudomonas syringae pv. cilantro]|uniref:Uncharacterized protein n=1 Tax=Pseudomonas syringae pv. cilantro TaxID=81035 RepID=A0A0N0GHV9_PSESX|nr:Unknown protein sequence [Pseudomonas syringae pv. cilantro]